jgi:flagellar biosynthesis protein FlhG
MTAPLVAIASGKGGVGKTFLAIALAQSHARTGRRTLLLDGDLGLANIDVQLGIQPKGDLLSVVSGGMDMAAAVSQVDGGAGAGGFDVLAGRSGSGALRALPARDIHLLGESIKLVAARYDRAIVDLGAGLDAAMLDIAAFCGRVLVVLTDEPTSLTDAYALIKVISQRPGAPALAVAVNMASDEREAGRSYGALERACLKFLGFAPPLAGFVLRDPRVRDAIRAQTPYLTRSPGGPAASGIARLSASLDTVFDSGNTTTARRA